MRNMVQVLCRAALAIVLAGAAGCGHENKSPGDIEWKISRLDETGPSCFPKMKFEIYWPVSGTNQIELSAIRSNIVHSMEWLADGHGNDDGDLKGMGPDEFVRMCSAAFRAMAEEAKQSRPDDAAVDGYCRRFSIRPFTSHAGTRTMVAELWGNEGGFHSFGETCFDVIDRTTGESLGLWDIVERYQADLLTDMIKEELRRIAGMEEGETFDQYDISEAAIKPAENCYPCDKGLVMHYNYDELGKDDYTLTLPWDKLQAASVLKPGFALRLGYPPAPVEAPTAAAAFLARIAGVYKNRFQNGNMDGAQYESEDKLEVVPVDDHAAYIRMALNFFNGHEGFIDGIAVYGNHSLIYDNGESGKDRCVVEFIWSRDSVITLADYNKTPGCRNYHGTRGSLNNARFSMKNRREIADLQQLKSSRGFKEAMNKYRH